MNRGSFITKEEAGMVQGIAALLMTFHHLFGFPERIAVPYCLILDFSFFKFETMLSYFGRICIAMFAFSSGYGMCKIAWQRISENPNPLLNGYQMSVRQLRGFYPRLWAVCGIFIPLGYFLGVYQFDGRILLKSILGISNFYNKEWWYTVSYLRFLIVFPLLFCILAGIDKLFPKRAKSIVAIGSILLAIAYILFDSGRKWGVALCFVSGMIVLTLGLFEKAYIVLQKFGKVRYLVALCGLGAASLTRIILGHNCDFDFLYAPIIIFCIVVLLKSDICKKTINKPLGGLIGKYSTYIWLTHTFFAYYYFQELTYAPRISFLILAWCITLTIITGSCIEWCLRFVQKRKPAK